MRVHSRVFVLTHPDHDEAPSPALVSAISEAGGLMGEPAHRRLIIEAPAERAEEVFWALQAAEMSDEVSLDDMRIYDLPEPSGKSLTVNFMYEETGQVCSATVDERLWAAMIGPNEEHVYDAFAVLYGDVEIDRSYAPGDDITVQDVMREVNFWSYRYSVDSDPAFWDDDEPMAKITFTAQAELSATGDLVEVNLPGLHGSTIAWEIPARLVPPEDPRIKHDALADSPITPREARLWARAAPFTLTVEMPGEEG